MDRPTDADRIMALSVLKGHVITDDPKVQSWVRLYRDFEPFGNPWDLDMVTGGWPYEAVDSYVHHRLDDDFMERVNEGGGIADERMG